MRRSSKTPPPLFRRGSALAVALAVALATLVGLPAAPAQAASVVTTISVGNNPSAGIALSPDGATLYVSNLGSDTVSIVSTSSSTVTGTISLGSGSLPGPIAVNPAGTRAYVTTHNSKLTPIDLTTSPPTLGTEFSAGTYPNGLAFSPDGSQLYVGGGISSNATKVFDTSNDTQITSISTPGSTARVAATATKVFAISVNGVVVINATANPPVALMTLDSTALGTCSPRAGALSPDGSKLWVTCTQGKVVVIRTSDYGIVGSTASTLGTAMVGIAVTATTAWTVNGMYGAYEVSLIDTTSLSILATVPVASGGTQTNIVATAAFGYAPLNNNPGTVAVVSAGIVLGSVSYGASALEGASGPAAGGGTVTLTGSGFTGSSALSSVTVGGVACSSISVTNDTTATCMLGAYTAGGFTNGQKTVDVVVTGTDASTSTKAGGFTYLETPVLSAISSAAGPTAGGGTLTLTGTGLFSASASPYKGMTVSVGGTDCVLSGASTATSATCTLPARSAGAANVSVTTNAGTSGTQTYRYAGTPTITAVSPQYVSTTAATPLTITGTGLLSGSSTATVTVGTQSCTSVTPNTDGTSLTCTVASGASAGAANISVTAAGGSLTTSNNPVTFAVVPVITAPSTGTPVSVSASSPGSLTVTGSDFGNAQGAGSVTVGTSGACVVTAWSATSITCTLPTGLAAGLHSLKVTAANSAFSTQTDAIQYVSSGGGSGGGGSSSSVTPTPTPKPTPAPSPSASSAPTAVPASAPTLAPLPPVAFKPATLPDGKRPELAPGEAVAVVAGRSVPVKVTADPATEQVAVKVGGTTLNLSANDPLNALIELSASGDLQVMPGGALGLKGRGMASSAEYDVYMFSTPTRIGQISTNPSGVYTGQQQVPATVKAGEHTLQIVGVDRAGRPFSVNLGVTVLQPPAAVLAPTSTTATAKTSKVTATVTFDAMSAKVTAAGKATLTKLVQKVGPKAVTSVVVGYTSEGSSAPADVSLAKARATAVAATLKSKGMNGKIAIRNGGTVTVDGPSQAPARKVVVTVTYTK